MKYLEQARLSSNWTMACWISGSQRRSADGLLTREKLRKDSNNNKQHQQTNKQTQQQQQQQQQQQPTSFA
jgi:hypothetical protein